MLPRNSLKAFLASSKSRLTTPNTRTTPLTFVIGNESADLDSLCSSILYAYLKTYTSKPTKNASPFYIPLSNLFHRDLRLRPELDIVLKKTSLQPSDLITLSDLPSNINPQTRWVLVDHNVLTGALGKRFSDRVVGVIDHHVDEKKHVSGCDEDKGGEGRIIEVAGSCASLVTRTCRDSWPKPDKALDNEVAMLALGAIIVDTQSLTSKDKTKPSDISAVEFLESLITDGEYDRAAYGKEINRAKGEVELLSLEELLRKDYKQWSNNGIELGISSVVKPMNYLIAKAGSQEEFDKIVKEFARERGLGLFSIMTTSNKKGVFKRELLLEAVDEGAVEAAEKFVEEGSERLGLKVWGEGMLDVGGEEKDGKGWRRCWVQEETKHSRKQVAPILRAAM